MVLFFGVLHAVEVKYFIKLPHNTPYMLKVVSLVEPPFLFWFREKQGIAQPLRPFPREGERLWRIYIPVA